MSTRGAIARTVPVRRDSDGSSFLTPVDLPLPEAAGHMPTGMHWQVDVILPGHRMPARPAMPGNALIWAYGLILPKPADIPPIPVLWVR